MQEREAQALFTTVQSAMELTTSLVVFLADNGFEDDLNKAGIPVAQVRQYKQMLQLLTTRPELAEKLQSKLGVEPEPSTPSTYNGGQYL